MIGAAPPGRPPTGLFLSSYENNQWMLTVWGGMLGNEPPCDRAGMLNFAHGYAPQHVWAAARAGEPLGEVVRHRMPWSQWRRYDKLRRLPAGLVVCGDAICSFNPPVYGQGMTVGALDALALRDCLRSGADDLPRRYFRKSAKSIAVAWRMSAGNDLAFPEVQAAAHWRHERRTGSPIGCSAYVPMTPSWPKSSSGSTTSSTRSLGFCTPPHLYFSLRRPNCATGAGESYCR